MKKEIQPVCRQAGEFYYQHLTEPSLVPQTVREHIEQCPFCREERRRLQCILEDTHSTPHPVRDDVLRSQMPLYDQWVGCPKVRPFLPLLAVADFLPSVPTPAAAHLAHCPACRHDRKSFKDLALSKKETLAASRALSGDLTAFEQLSGACAELVETIRRRTNSGILTRLNQSRMDETFRISVAEQAVGASHPRTPAGGLLVRWIRPAAAAAVLLIAALLFWQVRPVRGLDIHEVYQVLNQTVNVAITSYPQHGQNLIIASYAFEEQSPLQEIWVSNSLGVQLFIEKERAVLWDLNRQTKTVKTADGLETLALTDPIKKLEIPWGLLPFRSPSELPPKYKWKQVWLRPEDVSLGQCSVYDLTWTDFSGLGRAVERRWRGYLDPKTKFPLRIEWWEKLDEKPFKKITSTIIQYPSQEEVLRRIDAAGFDYRPAVQK